MVEISVGETIINKAGEVGTIAAFDGQYITVNYRDRSAKFRSDAFEKGFLRYENEALQRTYDEKKLAEAQKEAEARQSAERATEERRQIQRELSREHRRITVVSASIRLDPAKITLTSVRKKDQELIQQIFAACDADTEELYNSVKPEMEYIGYTYYGRSKFCVGFMTKYLDTYVFRLFSRNDVYTKDAQEFITITDSDTTEVLRALWVNGKFYCFSKNLASAGEYLVNTKANKNWHISDLSNAIMANKIIKKCDCRFLNDYIEHKNIDCLKYLKLAMPALNNNKVEILLKHRLFNAAYYIDDLEAYLEEYTPKQITVACENYALNALPFIKRFGNLERKVLEGLEMFMRKDKKGHYIYKSIESTVDHFGFECADLEKKVVGFLKKLDDFDPRIYCDYIRLLVRQPNFTLQDIFDKHYVERHYILMEQEGCNYTEEQEEAYREIAAELSWIDREENDYFIMIPKTISDFKYEGVMQNHCVYTNGYCLDVIDRCSIIVFLRKEKDTPFVTIEYDYDTFEVRQAFRKGNQPIPTDLYEFVKKLGEQLHYEMRSQQ